MDEAFRRWSEQRDHEMQEFLDALTQRHIGVTQQMLEAIQAMSHRLAESMTQLQAEVADQRAQIQANTRALLKVLDRLEPQQ